ncbi:DNA polymerase [Rhodoferax ferrireducens]|uniref:DNA polymerase n=1 Tax=Rhodoferax ferrireducens TaxID=192843 RepID=A0ABU2CB09_9BURK|nr:uracil-DNA glycosylase [Rhodoferax ferrireducens]MDR7378491.1 DNA polymerase [Rhodoferax ferrireducens]
MSLDLDTRQRAMLAEMHVPVWWPEAAAEPLPEPVPAPAPARSAPKSIAQAIADAPELVAARAASISAKAQNDAEPVAVAASSDWTGLRAAWATAQACVPLNTALGAQADWLVLGEALGVSESGQPFEAPEAQLLANMLQAVGISTRPDARSACITSLLKTPALDGSDPLAASEPHLRQLVALLQPKLILALGPFAAQLLLRDSTPLGQMRGRVHRFHGVPVVVSYHPSMLLRNRPEKAKAWADLCLALGAMA